MTPTEILASIAGPELDALVAEHIMGKRWYINEHGRYFLIDPESALLDIIQPCAAPPPERFQEAARMNNGHPYSADWKLAIQVFFRALTTTGWANITADMEDYGREPGDIVTVRIGDHWTVTGIGPRAICQAALLALLEDSTTR